MSEKLLFHSYDYFSVTQAAKERLKTAAQKLSLEVLNSNDVNSLVSSLVDEVAFTTPVLKVKELAQSTRETQMDASHHYNRFFFPGQSTLIPATELTIHVPFGGEALVFEVQPTTYTLNPPRGTIASGELLYRVSIPHDQQNDPLPEFRKWLQAVESNLSVLRSGEIQLRAELSQLATQQLAMRKQQLEKTNSFLGGLNIPTKQPVVLAAVSATATKARVRAGKPRQWDVFISHATDDKADFVAELASRLRADGFEVWYDDFVVKVGDSLRRKIDEGLLKSRFGVVVLSKPFFAKQWTVKELMGLRAVRATSYFLFGTT